MSFAAGKDPYTVQGTPEPKSGTRIVPIAELVQKLNESPELREAVSLYERANLGGRESMIKNTVRNQLKHDREADMAAKQNKQIIDFAMKKKEGKLK